MAEANYSIKAQIEANTRKFKSAIQSAKKVAQNFKKTQESIKDTKLDGDSSGVMKAVKAAKESVESFDGVEGKAELDVDSSKLREQVNAAKGIVNSFDHLHADAEISADIKRAKTNIKALEKYIEAVDNKDADIDVSADISKAMKRLDILRTNLSTITNKNYDAELTADATRAREAIKRAKHELNDFARQRAKATVEVDMKGATTKIQWFKAMLRSIPNRHRTRLDVDGNPAMAFLRQLHKGLENYSNSLDKLANDIRSFGTVFGNMIKGSLLSNISLLVPAIASVVPALMAVLNALVVVAGGAAGLAGAFGVAGAGVMAFGAMGVSALKMLSDGTLQATRETERYQASLDSLKSAWAGLIQQNQAQIFNTLANAIDTAKVALAGLTPLSTVYLKEWNKQVLKCLIGLKLTSSTEVLRDDGYNWRKNI